MPRTIAPALAVLLLLTLSGCTDNDARAQAAQARAGELATALTDRKLGALPVSGGAQQQLDTVLAGIDDIPAKVTAGGVAVDGDVATATLKWDWGLPGQAWTYETKAQFQWVDDAWTVQWAPSVVEPSLTGRESLKATTTQSRRGDILGADDTPLVTPRSVVHIGIDKNKITAAQAPKSAKALAELVGIAPGPYAKAVKQAGAKAFVEAIVLRKAAAKRIDQDALAAIPGAVALPGKLPLAPTRDFASAILGRVGPATAEIVKKSQGAVLPGDQVGLSGLQARYEQQLAGTPGVRVAAVTGTQERELLATQPVNGEPLRTTFDEHLQRAAESALQDVVPASAVVALRPSTGDILAAASGPGSNGYNTATIGQYAPGSTFKVVTALALMRAGVKPTDRVPCTAKLVVDGKTFKNYDDYPASRMGDIPLRSAVANSCNTAMISQRNKLKGDDLIEAAADLGLGVDHDLGFPAYFGQVPRPGSETEKAASLIGQGKVLASPMAMAAVAASVAQGTAVVPQLLPDQVDPSGSSAAKSLTAQEAKALRDMMRAVVTEGTSSFLRDLPGPPVRAKTGTAEFGSDNPLKTHTWMIATQGDLAVAVFVDVGKSGSQTAGPILEQFLRAAR